MIYTTCNYFDTATVSIGIIGTPAQNRVTFGPFQAKLGPWMELKLQARQKDLTHNKNDLRRPT